MARSTAAPRSRPGNGYSAGETAILQLLGETDSHGAVQTQAPLANIDPTVNVSNLVLLHVRRIDDLRIASERRQDDMRDLTQMWRNKLDDLRDLHTNETIRTRFAAQGDLAQAESRRIDAQMVAEARRIDALLAAAANAVTLASTRAELTATALAERVDTSAKTLAGSVEASASSLRLQVQTTNDAIATQIGILRTETGNRLTTLEQSRYGLAAQKEQRSETATESRWNERQRSQRVEWQVGLYVAAGIAIAGFALKALGILH